MIIPLVIPCGAGSTRGEAVLVSLSPDRVSICPSPVVEPAAALTRGEAAVVTLSAGQGQRSEHAFGQGRDAPVHLSGRPGAKIRADLIAGQGRPPGTTEVEAAQPISPVGQRDKAAHPAQPGSKVGLGPLPVVKAAADCQSGHCHLCIRTAAAGNRRAGFHPAPHLA